MSGSDQITKGLNLEIRVLHFLHDNGFDARLSDNNRTWDIEVYLPSAIHRLQVKSGFWHQNKWVIGLSKSGGRGKNNIPYERSDFDFLVFDDPSGRLYLVPSSCLHLSRETKDKLPTTPSGMHIRYSDYLVYANN